MSITNELILFMNTYTLSNPNKIISDFYNLASESSSLDGETDYNFKISSGMETYLLKICKPEVPEEEVQFQVALIDHIQKYNLSFDVPFIIPNKMGNSYFSLLIDGQTHLARLHSWVPGIVVDDIIPKSRSLYYSWGATCGELSLVLSEFDHEGAHRFDKWNPVESLYSKQYADYIKGDDRQALASYAWNVFESQVIPVLADLRCSVNYSDAHQHNLLVKLDHKTISGVIDFGDAIYAPTICELAIACAYAAMDTNDPIGVMCQVINGYQSKFKLKEKEIAILLPLIFGRLMITVANAAYNGHVDPDNIYLQVSADPAWRLLDKLKDIDLTYAHYRFRSACGWEANPKRDEWDKWRLIHKDAIQSPILIENHNVMDMDLSVGSLDLGNNSNFENIDRFSITINRILEDHQATLGIGGYGEVRPFYTTNAYKEEGNNGPRWRTMHLGTDYWTTAGTSVHAACDGVIHSVKNNDAECDYGPTLIIKHSTDAGLEFYTLYGHLSLSSLHSNRIGDQVSKGDKIAEIGEQNINGSWPPHLHFQIILDLFGNEGDFPGVCYVDESGVWISNSPRLSTDNFSLDLDGDKWRLKDERQKVLGKSLSTSYTDHLHMVRGYKQYLYDSAGRRYLDMVNNVAHVGHEHPHVIKAATRQINILNTNTRYINKNITKYAEQLLSKCPDGLDVVFFVNSGSEANELALRMTKMYTDEKDMIALEIGYHGNTGGTIDISSYKFDGKGGQGAPEHTSIVPMPDIYRGECNDPEIAGRHYAQYIEEAILNIKKKGRNVAGFIAESILSCGGQIVLPDHYLEEAYRIVRAAGGLCIADEVQVGFGRVGSHYWGFELQNVVPDILTCGKPIGNGHPLAAVVTTREVADRFSNGMEYFNTFGGNPVSCAIGSAVLDIIDKEELRKNAQKIGTHLITGLKELMAKHDIIGDVRGVGLFCGIELVRDRISKEPADHEASFIVERMREQGILLSTDGPLYNVIKMKPPMCFTIENVDEMIKRLDGVLSEVRSLSILRKWN